MQGAASAYGDDWAFLGQYASRTTKQETWRRRAPGAPLALRPTNAVAAHSGPCVFETGDTASGGEFLETWLKGFDPRAPYHVHLSWHQALFELARGHYQRRRLYGRLSRPAGRNSAPALNDSAALLWRVYLQWRHTAVPARGSARPGTPAASRPGPAFRMPMLPWPSRWPAMRSPWGR